MHFIDCPLATLNLCKNCPSSGKLLRKDVLQHTIDAQLTSETVLEIILKNQKLTTENNNMTHQLTHLSKRCNISEYFVSELDKSVFVEFAGVSDVNGEYKLVDIMHRAGLYERYGPYNDQNDARFVIYKSSMHNGGFQWFLAHTPDGCETGGEEDVDFYFQKATSEDIIPPSNEWCACVDTVPNVPLPIISVEENNQYSDKWQNSGGSGEESGDEGYF
jgi:hypothetical protein